MQTSTLPSPDFHFTVSNVYTIDFPIPSSLFKSDKDRLFYVSGTDGRTTKKTVPVKYEDHSQALRWNDTLDGFRVKDSSSQFTLKVYEKHRLRPEELLATFVLSYDMLRSSRKSLLLQCAEDTKKPLPKGLCLTLSDCSDSLSHAKVEIEKAREDKARMQNPSGSITDTVDTVNKFGKGFATGDKVVTSVVDFCRKRKDVLDRVAFVMNALDVIAELHPYAKLAWSVISFIPMKISEQIDLDQAVVKLLDAMDQALDLAQDGETLKLRCGRSDNHKKTLKCLIDLITECGYFIQFYLKDVNFWKRFMKNVLSNGKVAVENYRASLKKLRDDFVSEAIVNVEMNLFRIIEKVEDHDLDMKLRELPYGIGTRFNPGRGCLPQTRVKFLDAIINWVNDLDPQSPRVLMLVGQAGTGKSSIANEVAHRFHHVDRLTTSYCFVRGQPSSQECYRFFTTLACDLCNKYPSFRTFLGKVINNNRDLVHARDFMTLFETLLRNPLHDACLTSPVFIVIDALDENEDSAGSGLDAGSGSLPFHSFLGRHLSEFPPNFRILITSRPELDIMNALPPSSFVRHMQMHDEELAGDLDQDLLTYVRTQLRDTDIDERTFHMLAKRAEHLFQWASVACFYIANPPRGLNSKSCLQRVLYPSVSKKAIHPLDALYMTVLERFDMDDDDIADNFRSVMGQILGAYEPLPIVALNMLYQSGTAEDDDLQGTTVSDMVKEMGSLLSNVTPPNSRNPIDFL